MVLAQSGTRADEKRKYQRYVNMRITGWNG